MNRLLAILAACSALLFAQAEKPQEITKVVRVRYAVPKAIADLLNPGSNGYIAVGDNGLKAIVLKGRADKVAEAEQTIKELDIPPPTESAHDIDVTIYIVGGTSKSQSSSAAPKEIEPVIKQLQSIFPYSSYELLNTVAIRSREGKQASNSGQMKQFGNTTAQTPTFYGIVYDTSIGSPQAIRFDRFRFDVRSGNVNVAIGTDLEVHPGQKVVVGKTNIDNGESALFVVLTARIVE